MADTSTGMSENIGGNTSLSSRLMCCKCGVEPRIKKADANGTMISLTVSCHGEEESAMIDKKDLIFTKYFFGDPNE
jgi:hypothetical protein